MTTIEKQVKAAQKRMATFIEKLAAKAREETAESFAEARVRIVAK